jgi:CRP-like cAMP-binding protein
MHEVDLRNRLLRSLPPEDYARLGSQLELVDLAFKQPLYAPQQPIPFVYFLEGGVVSLLITMHNGATVEVATVGHEGFVGVPVFLGATSLPGTALCQIPGSAFRLPAASFREAVRQNHALQLAAERYTQGLFNEIAQSAACNRLHTIPQRASRWLLLTHDRVQADSYPLTHEFLSQMLGVRRAGATEALGELQRAGLIRSQRGQLTIVNRAGLERLSCECYWVVRTEYDRLT